MQNMYPMPGQIPVNQKAVAPMQWQPPPAKRPMVASDRLPAMPELLRRNVKTPPVAAKPRTERQAEPVQPNQLATWQPIDIPTPAQLGLAQRSGATANSVGEPERMQLDSVAAWLDQLGAKSWQRDRMAEGIRISCCFPLGTSEHVISVEGRTDDQALRALVKGVQEWKQGRVVLRQ